jgi:hypothetical protein
MRMPFGRFKNKELTDIPRSYLQWLRSQDWLGGWLALAVDEALGVAPSRPSNEPWQPSEGEPWPWAGFEEEDGSACIGLDTNAGKYGLIGIRSQMRLRPSTKAASFLELDFDCFGGKEAFVHASQQRSHQTNFHLFHLFGQIRDWKPQLAGCTAWLKRIFLKLTIRGLVVQIRLLCQGFPMLVCHHKLQPIERREKVCSDNQLFASCIVKAHIATK